MINRLWRFTALPSYRMFKTSWHLIYVLGYPIPIYSVSRMPLPSTCPQAQCTFIPFLGVTAKYATTKRLLVVTMSDSNGPSWIYDWSTVLIWLTARIYEQFKVIPDWSKDSANIWMRKILFPLLLTVQCAVEYCCCRILNWKETLF